MSRVAAVVAVLGLVGGAVFGGEVTSWEPEVFGGLGDADNDTVMDFASFNGFLYAGVMNTNDGCEVWARAESPDFMFWFQVGSSGMDGDLNNYGVSALAPLHTATTDALFAGTANSNTGCELWRSDDGTTFSQVLSDGLGSGAGNFLIGGMVQLGTSLFIGTSNNLGLQIHELDGANHWVRVTGGLGGNPDNDRVLSMIVHDGELYVGTRNETDGAEIWKSADGVSWSRVVQGGFFGSYGVYSMASVAGALYAAVESVTGMEVHLVGDPFTIQVNSDGFGDAANWRPGGMVGHAGKLYVGTDTSVAGGEVWRMEGILDWEQVAITGFGDLDNSAVHALESFDGNLYAGSTNLTDGAGVWQLPLIFADGFESQNALAWSSASR